MSTYDRLADCLAEHLGRHATQLEPDVPLAHHGLDSVSAAAVCAAIEDRFGVTVEPGDIWDHPTPAALHGFLGLSQPVRKAS